MKTKLIILLILTTMIHTNTVNAQHSQLKRADFQQTIDGKQTDLYFLRNKNGIEIAITNFGGRVVEFWTPDKKGHFEDIVLGHDHVDKYLHYKGERFLGATIGRYGNRINKGKFTLNGQTYQLPINDTPNSLHGGFKGFDMVVWDVEQPDSQTLQLTYLSKDGEEGYPGNLQVSMNYKLTDKNEFIITHQAQTDKETVINLTHHSFFNLHGAGNKDINDHILMINADKFTPVDQTLIPTGILQDAEGTPMDFRRPTPIGKRVNDSFEQLEFGHGYDHNWVLNRKTSNTPELAATVYEPASGRYLEVWTTEPGLQFYGGNFFDGTMTGKHEKKYNYRASLALETQHYPDSPNQPEFPSTTLLPRDTYKHICIYKINVQ